MYIQASLMFICPLNVCTCGAMFAALLFGQEQKVLSFVSFVMMDIRMYGQKLVSALTVEWTLFVFLCSFVLVSLLLLLRDLVGFVLSLR